MTIKARIGTVVQTDFGIGPIVAITKEWLIHHDEKGREVCIYLPFNSKGSAHSPHPTTHHPMTAIPTRK